MHFNKETIKLERKKFERKKETSQPIELRSKKPAETKKGLPKLTALDLIKEETEIFEQNPQIALIVDNIIQTAIEIAEARKVSPESSDDEYFQQANKRFASQNKRVGSLVMRYNEQTIQIF